MDIASIPGYNLHSDDKAVPFVPGITDLEVKEAKSGYFYSTPELSR